jgi:ABC-type methionine transport system ATPase subunit
LILVNNILEVIENVCHGVKVNEEGLVKMKTMIYKINVDQEKHHNEFIKRFEEDGVKGNMHHEVMLSEFGRLKSLISSENGNRR